uniref:Uncharacterized protein n=1 Tax=Catharus ustulatus TaxID=91951 RepID=A0A8C3UVC5_CATUS
QFLFWGFWDHFGVDLTNFWGEFFWFLGVFGVEFFGIFLEFDPFFVPSPGFHLPPALWAVLGRRYGDESGNLDFDNFISCLVRLDAMFRAFKSLDRDGSGQIRVSLQEVGLGLGGFFGGTPKIPLG